jgi:hypothetical protein
MHGWRGHVLKKRASGRGPDRKPNTHGKGQSRVCFRGGCGSCHQQSQDLHNSEVINQAQITNRIRASGGYIAGAEQAWITPVLCATVTMEAVRASYVHLVCITPKFFYAA